MAKHLSRRLCFGFFVLSLCGSAAAQRIAVLTPGENEIPAFGLHLADKLGGHRTVLDSELSQAAFDASRHVDALNMTTMESKNAGAAIGCDFMILLRTANNRRSGVKAADYFEASAAIYLISSRTGRLVAWTIPTFKSASEADASMQLTTAAESIARELVTAMRNTQKHETSEPQKPQIDGLPPEGSPAAKGFRAPIPYRRIKPEYTSTAFLYGVVATVEIEVDLDAAGNIMRTEIVRWAGYSLDESVEKAVRSMNWRPAEFGGKQLPIRVLLRYNFKKVDPKP